MTRSILTVLLYLLIRKYMLILLGSAAKIVLIGNGYCPWRRNGKFLAHTNLFTTG